MIARNRIKPEDINAGYMLIRKGGEFTFDKSSSNLVGTGAGRKLLVSSEGMYDYDTGQNVTSIKPEENVYSTTTFSNGNINNNNFTLAVIAVVAIVAIVALKK